MSQWNFTLELEIYTILGIVFKGCLNGGCEEKKHNARYSQQLQTGTGREHPSPSSGPAILRGQSELISWWFVPNHIHGTSSSFLLSRYNRLALAVTYGVVLNWQYSDRKWCRAVSQCNVVHIAIVGHTLRQADFFFQKFKILEPKMPSLELL